MSYHRFCLALLLLESERSIRCSRPPACCSQAIKDAAELVPEVAQAEVQQVTAGVMPYPADAHPIIGFAKQCPNLYIAVMHSGATLAPLIGKLVAEEITTGQDLDVLTPYRLERDFSDLSNIY